MARGNVCSVGVCKNTYSQAKKTGEKLKFFGFPKDIKIRQEWIKKCCRTDIWKPDNKRICSKHFTADDYEDKMQAELLHLQPRKLKKHAIPSLFLLPEQQETDGIPEGTKPALNKKRKTIVKRFTHVEPKHKPSDQAEQIIDNVGINISEVPLSSVITHFDILQRKFEALQQENMLLKEKIAQHVETEKSLRQQVKKGGDTFEEKVLLAFKDFLTSNHTRKRKLKRVGLKRIDNITNLGCKYKFKKWILL